MTISEDTEPFLFCGFFFWLSTWFLLDFQKELMNFVQRSAFGKSLGKVLTGVSALLVFPKIVGWGALGGSLLDDFLGGFRFFQIFSD